MKYGNWISFASIYNDEKRIWLGIDGNWTRKNLLCGFVHHTLLKTHQ